MIRLVSLLLTFCFFIYFAFAIGKNGTKSNIEYSRIRRNYVNSVSQTTSYRLPYSDRFYQSSIKYFLQKLDHFDTTNVTQWYQRYFEDATHFNLAQKNVAAGKRKIPQDDRIFLMIGGEGSLEQLGWMNTGMWMELAKIYHALRFFVEHRYYGLSQPTNDDLSMDSLKFLTIAQALQDLANFISAHKFIYPNSKWIVFGGSYAGALAAWMRRNYPQLVDGAVASSACFPGKPFLPEYYQRVNDALTKSYSPKCTNEIQKAFGALHNLMTNDNCYYIEIVFNVATLDLCKTNFQKSLFFQTLAQGISSHVLSNDIKTLCDEMTKPSKFGRELHLGSAIEKRKGFEKIRADYATLIEGLRLTQGIKSIYLRQWYYQLCTEFGNLQSSESENQPFYNYFDQNFVLQLQCTDIFGSRYNEKFIANGIKKIINDFGGLDSEFPDTIFTVGTLDPWYDTQMNENNLAGNIVIKIKGSFHCDDMQLSSPKDSTEMQNAKREINEYLKKIIEKPLDSDSEPVGEPEFKYILQELDHYNPNIIYEWDQRYLEDFTYFNAEQPKAGDKRIKHVENRPVFLLIGGQHPINAAMMKTGLWVQLAKIHHALLFCVEHRYYGLSQPKKDLSTENLQYLTVAQALKDLEIFIRTKKSNLGLLKNKWIAFGSNYAGTLAAWMRREYPKLIKGAIASSAIFPKDVFVPEYYKRMSDALTSITHSSDCTDNIGKAVDELRNSMEDNKNCKEIESSYNVEFKETCISPNEKSIFIKFLASKIAQCIKSDCINTLCVEMNKESTFPRLQHLATAIVKINDNKKWVIDYQTSIRKHTSTQITETGYVRQTLYQKCTELGNILTFDSAEQPFYDPDDQNFMLRMSCTDIFGEDFNAQSITNGIGMIGVNYGGLTSTLGFLGTIFIVGSRDLWIDAQMRQINDGDNTVIEIKGSFDSDDMKPTRPTDSTELKEARLQINNYVKKIINGKN